jgi:hypothetical protein
MPPHLLRAVDNIRAKSHRKTPIFVDVDGSPSCVGQLYTILREGKPSLWFVEDFRQVRVIRICAN